MRESWLFNSTFFYLSAHMDNLKNGNLSLIGIGVYVPMLIAICLSS